MGQRPRHGGQCRPDLAKFARCCRRLDAVAKRHRILGALLQQIAGAQRADQCAVRPGNPQMAKSLSRHAGKGPVDKFVTGNGHQRALANLADAGLKCLGAAGVDCPHHVALGNNPCGLACLRLKKHRTGAGFHHQGQCLGQGRVVGDCQRRAAHQIGDPVAVGKTVNAGIVANIAPGAVGAAHPVPAGFGFPIDPGG